MKNLKLLKVPELIGKDAVKAHDALTEAQRADVKAKLDYVEHILTAFPQGADGEQTPSGGCPCGTCYKADEQMRDAVTHFAAVVDEYGYAVVRWYCFPDTVLPLVLTVYLNLPDKKATKKAAA